MAAFNSAIDSCASFCLTAEFMYIVSAYSLAGSTRRICLGSEHQSPDIHATSNLISVFSAIHDDQGVPLHHAALHSPLVGESDALKGEIRLTWLRLREDLLEAVVAKVGNQGEEEEACADLAQVDSPRHLPMALSR